MNKLAEIKRKARRVISGLSELDTEALLVSWVGQPVSITSGKMNEDIRKITGGYNCQSLSLFVKSEIRLKLAKKGEVK